MMTFQRFLEERFGNYRGAKVTRHFDRLAILIPAEYGTHQFLYELGYKVAAHQELVRHPSDPNYIYEAWGLSTYDNETFQVQEVWNTGAEIVIFNEYMYIDPIDEPLGEPNDEI